MAASSEDEELEVREHPEFSPQKLALYDDLIDRDGAPLPYTGSPPAGGLYTGQKRARRRRGRRRRASRRRANRRPSSAAPRRPLGTLGPEPLRRLAAAGRRRTAAAAAAVAARRRGPSKPATPGGSMCPSTGPASSAGPTRRARARRRLASGCVLLRSTRGGPAAPAWRPVRGAQSAKSVTKPGVASASVSWRLHPVGACTRPSRAGNKFRAAERLTAQPAKT